MKRLIIFVLLIGTLFTVEVYAKVPNFTAKHCRSIKKALGVYNRVTLTYEKTVDDETTVYDLDLNFKAMVVTISGSGIVIRKGLRTGYIKEKETPEVTALSMIVHSGLYDTVADYITQTLFLDRIPGKVKVKRLGDKLKQLSFTEYRSYKSSYGSKVKLILAGDYNLPVYMSYKNNKFAIAGKYTNIKYYILE